MQSANIPLNIPNLKKFIKYLSIEKSDHKNLKLCDEVTDLE